MKNIYAKRYEDCGIINRETLEDHTKKVLDKIRFLLVQNKLKFDKISKLTSKNNDYLEDLLFFSAYFHDIGKATYCFQTKLKGEDVSSCYHPFLALALLFPIKDFVIKGERNLLGIYPEINLLALIVATHHTLYKSSLYTEDILKEIDPEKEFILDYLESFWVKYPHYYREILGRRCKYFWQIKLTRDFYKCWREIEDDLNNFTSQSSIEMCEGLKLIYSLILGNLNIADWQASNSKKIKPTLISWGSLPTPELISTHLSRKFKKTVALYDFQEKSKNSKSNILVKIPTGEGKTEAALLWSINNLRDSQTKIIYTVPTQVISNHLFSRVLGIFGKDNSAIVHSDADLVLNEEFFGEKELDKRNYVRSSEILFQKTFNKPVTVSTLDAFLKYFLNIGRWNIPLQNYLNSVVIIDEVHTYDFKILGFLARTLEVLNRWGIRVCIMSASVPEFVEKKLKLDKFSLVIQEDLFKKVSCRLTKKHCYLKEETDLIQHFYHNKKNVLVVCNTVKEAQRIFGLVKKRMKNVMLYHSRFRKIDRQRKEIEIEKKLNNKANNFILIATQVVEIGLDVDFDVLFTEIAPIDALIQRCGRVNRQKNKNRIAEVYVYKNVDSYNKKGKWSYPYRKEFMDRSFALLKNGEHSINTYNSWLQIFFDELNRKNLVFQNELESKFAEGYQKYDQILKEDFIKTDFKVYELRDIDPRFSNINVYLKDDYEKHLREKHLSKKLTLQIPTWLYKELDSQGKAFMPENSKIFYPVVNLKYSYINGLDIQKSILEKDNII